MKLVVLDSGMIDLAFGPAGLEKETTLSSAVIISLLSDRRATADDVLPDAPLATAPLPADRRGWCGDALSEFNSHLIGSRLWLLLREKQTEETRRRAIAYIREALQWMFDDGHIVALDVTAEWVKRGRLAATIILTLPDGTRYSQELMIGGAHAI